MYCFNCGTELPDDAKFCSKCGSQIDEKGSEPTQEIQQSTIAVEKVAEKTVTKMDKRARPKWQIVAIVVVLLIAISIMAKDFIAYSVSPELYIKSAINNTAKNISKDFSKMQSLLFRNIEQGTSNTSNVKFLINNISHSNSWTDEDLYMLNGMELDFTTAVDNKKKELFFDGICKFRGEDLISLKLKLDDNELILNIPELYYNSISVPSKRFGSEFNNSIFGMNADADVDDSTDISFSNLIDKNTKQEIDKKTKTAYINGLKKMIENANYQKDGSENLHIGGINKKCNKTILILEDNSVKNGLIDIIEAMKHDNRIEQWEKYMRSTNQGYEVMEFEESLDELKNEIIDNFSIDHMKVNLFTYKGNIVKFDFEIIPDKDYQDEKLTVTLELLDNKNLLDDIRFILNVGDGDGKIVFESSGNHLGSDNIYTDDTKFIIFDYGEEIIRLKSSTEIQLNKKSNNLVSNMDLIFDNMNMKINTKGDFNSTQKLVECNFKDTEFTLTDYFGETLRLNCSVAISSEEGVKNTFDISAVNKINLFDMDESDFYYLLYIIEENAYWIGNKIEGY